MYTSQDPSLEETKWKELIWTLFDENLKSSEPVNVLVDGENFDLETKYNIKIIPRGEIEGLPSDPVIFQTGNGSNLFFTKIFLYFK